MSVQPERGESFPHEHGKKLCREHQPESPEDEGVLEPAEAAHREQGAVQEDIVDQRAAHRLGVCELAADHAPVAAPRRQVLADQHPVQPDVEHHQRGQGRGTEQDPLELHVPRKGLADVVTGQRAHRPYVGPRPEEPQPRRAATEPLGVEGVSQCQQRECGDRAGEQQHRCEEQAVAPARPDDSGQTQQQPRRRGNRAQNAGIRKSDAQFAETLGENATSFPIPG